MPFFPGALFFLSKSRPTQCAMQVFFFFQQRVHNPLCLRVVCWEAFGAFQPHIEPVLLSAVTSEKGSCHQRHLSKVQTCWHRGSKLDLLIKGQAGARQTLRPLHRGQTIHYWFVLWGTEQKHLSGVSTQHNVWVGLKISTRERDSKNEFHSRSFTISSEWTW